MLLDDLHFFLILCWVVTKIIFVFILCCWVTNMGDYVEVEHLRHTHTQLSSSQKGTERSGTIFSSSVVELFFRMTNMKNIFNKNQLAPNSTPLTRGRKEVKPFFSSSVFEWAIF